MSRGSPEEHASSRKPTAPGDHAPGRAGTTPAAATPADLGAPGDHAVTRLLVEARAGDDAALDRLLKTLYGELHGIAERHMRGERKNHTLQPTALLHEAVLKLLGRTELSFDDRHHFLRSASQAMRRVLVDHARARNALKRGGGLNVTLDESIAGRDEAIIDMLVLDQALDRLAAAEPRWAQVVELRFFTGLEIAEVADVLGTSTATVKRDWQFARAWLARELGDAPPSGVDRPAAGDEPGAAGAGK